MQSFPIEDPQFWLVTILAVGALYLVYRRRRGNDKGSCNDCSGN